MKEIGNLLRITRCQDNEEENVAPMNKIKKKRRKMKSGTLGIRSQTTSQSDSIKLLEEKNREKLLRITRCQDSEEENFAPTNKIKKKRCKKKSGTLGVSSQTTSQSDSIKLLEEKNHDTFLNIKHCESKEESVIILSEDESENIDPVNISKQRKRKRKDSQTFDVDLQSIAITPTNFNNSIELLEEKDGDASVIILEPVIDETLPLFSNESSNKRESVIILEPQQSKSCFTTSYTNETIGKPHRKKRRKIEESNCQTINISSSVPIYCAPRPLLRPIAIDGSNVARLHGISNNVFSCAGIKICVDYFLKRGHQNVMVFVPHWRRHGQSSRIPTIGAHILEELERSQNLAFTPSRIVNGKGYSCYDDRFVVEYASSNGGVILSNDNFRDLLNESVSFRETIEKRLLMYCFAHNKLMIPNDPLGRNGPKLNEFLAFPPNYGNPLL